MAYGLYRNGKYADARDFFRFLTIADTHDRKHWMGLGACYQMLNEYQPAIECYSVAAVQNPDDPYVHFYAAECIYCSGNLDLAIKTLESALTVGKKSDEHRPFISKLRHLYDVWSEQTKGARHD